MSLRVAFDVDGVFADMESALRGLVVASKGPARVDAHRNLTAAERRLAWRCVRRTDGFWETLEPLEPGALERLHAVSRVRRWQVAFLTQRPQTAGDSAQLQTQRWLERHGFPHASVFVVSGARGKLAAALNLDFVIDDVPRYCLDVQLESRATPCLVWRGDEWVLPPGTKRLGIEVFPSVDECLDFMTSRDARRARTPGLAERIRHHLGLGPRVSP